MEEDIEILKKIKYELIDDLRASHLTNNKVPELQEAVDRIIAKKKEQIQALNDCIQRLEDLYNE